ncbi:hypothetical protein Agub_g447 [Astrephomene gubernaculifera]|uniref:Uncharacterized protein n=1 Tax=Astrephomene gubernaculifera TaxID=47775 RepID=A0AAD3DFE5_9CHLO|nr:hypothetical protein Agub_g447 [Astrephomene gubernaculifera]
MALARVFARRAASCIALAPRCVRSIQHESKTNIQPSGENGDDAPSTSSEPTVGWLRGPKANKPNKSIEDEWEELRDPQTGAVSWRSLLTGEKTVPGAPKPDTWIEVVDKRTGLIYYWCKRTGETTILGEPKPGPYGRKMQVDPDELQLDEGGGRGGAAKEGGPSLMRLVTNPLVMGVAGMAVLGIAYEVMFK